jgi:hypothetical protein
MPATGLKAASIFAGRGDKRAGFAARKRGASGGRRAYSDSQFKQREARLRILATRCARVLLEFFALRNSEGAGNAGCALHPRSHAQCAQEVRA